MHLQDKVVLVTGAANGIGRATAQHFAARGARLVITDIEEDTLAQAASELPSGTIAFKADVTSEAEVGQMIERAITEAGGLDVLVCNAGVSLSGPAEHTSIEDWRWIMDVNVWSHIYAVRAALPHMKQRGSGHLVHIASAAGILGGLDLTAYCTTKFAVYGLAESLAISLEGTGIGVSVVCPQWVATNIVERGRTAVDPSVEQDPEAAKRATGELVRAVGLPPAEVGRQIAEAVEGDRFLVLPHPEVLKFAQLKWSDPDAYIEKAARAQRQMRHLTSR